MNEKKEKRKRTGHILCHMGPDWARGFDWKNHWGHWVQTLTRAHAHAHRLDSRRLRRSVDQMRERKRKRYFVGGVFRSVNRCDHLKVTKERQREFGQLIKIKGKRGVGVGRWAKGRRGEGAMNTTLYTTRLVSAAPLFMIGRCGKPYSHANRTRLARIVRSSLPWLVARAVV